MESLSILGVRKSEYVLGFTYSDGISAGHGAYLEALPKFHTDASTTS